jgi:hypothetical protein
LVPKGKNGAVEVGLGSLSPVGKVVSEAGISTHNPIVNASPIGERAARSA